VSRTTSKIAALRALAPSPNNLTIIPELKGRMEGPEIKSVWLDMVEFSSSLIDFTAEVGQSTHTLPTTVRLLCTPN
jgi:hypothetical protein